MSAAQSIIDELKDVETAFGKLFDPEVYNLPEERFNEISDLRWFQTQKQRYKKLRDDAWRWLTNHGVNPKKRQDLERGDDTAADNPFRWSVHASFVRQELLQALQHNIPVSSVAQNLYLINFTGLTRQP